MAREPQYITKAQYLEHSGIDLQIELANAATDNPSDIVDIFLCRTEDWMLAEILGRYNLDPNSDAWDSDAFKTACLHQIDYLRMNGEISIRAINEAPALARNAFRVLHNAGMTSITEPRVQTNSWV
jgi:hypothetical protein